MLIFCNASLTGLLSTCPLSTPSARWRWRSVRSTTSQTQTETGPLTTWPFMCRFSFWSHRQTSDFFSPRHVLLLPLVTSRVLSMVGLSLIALGTGGIKPCVAAFGGDQFGDHQVRFTSVLVLLSPNVWPLAPDCALKHA